MKTKVRLVVLVGLVAAMFLLSGCFFNVFQTAQTVGKGNVSISLGAAMMNLSLQQGKYNWVFTPQAGVRVGVTDNVDLGIKSGFLIGSSGKPGFLGAIGDLKITLIQDPTSFSFAVGIGGGYSPGHGGWGVDGSIYLDSNIKFLPIYVVYRPIVPIGADKFTIQHQFAGGLHLNLSDNARILVEVDSWGGLLSGGIALDIRF